MGLPCQRQAGQRGEQVLAQLHARPRARLRIYIGAAPGVGKTYSMIEDAHALRREGIDVVIGFVETHGRADTEARVGDLALIPRRQACNTEVSRSKRWISTRSSCGDPRSASSTSSRTRTRLEAVTRNGIRTSQELLDAGIGVMTAVNVQHVETLNDAVSRVTGVRVRETVPDTSRPRRRDRQRGRDRRRAAQPVATRKGVHARQSRAGVG